MSILYYIQQNMESLYLTINKRQGYNNIGKTFSGKNNTVCFTDLGKQNLPIVVRF